MTRLKKITLGVSQDGTCCLSNFKNLNGFNVFKVAFVVNKRFS